MEDDLSDSSPTIVEERDAKNGFALVAKVGAVTETKAFFPLGLQCLWQPQAKNCGRSVTTTFTYGEPPTENRLDQVAKVESAFTASH